MNKKEMYLKFIKDFNNIYNFEIITKDKGFYIIKGKI